MTAQVLLLNADYNPLKVIDWQRAITLLLDHKATLVEKYEGMLINSATQSFDWPAVVALKKYVVPSAHVKLSRANVLARDGYKCMYCLTRPRTPTGRPRLEELTIDHVVPRAQGRIGKLRGRPAPVVRLPWNGKVVAVTSWENVVSACMGCNHDKRDRTPSQAGMKLHKLPQRPNVMDVIVMQFTRMTIPDEWKTYLPKGSPWADYWDGELHD